jgi:predicted ABC-class ATPase
MGLLRGFLGSQPINATQSSIVSIPGMLIPKGITLVAGGGYHGKSTLLRAIASGVYDKIPGDGRDTCVTVRDAMSLRAEDGRYVNNCNISAFISNLPTPPGVTSTVDTTHFSSHEASGSTSQAANVAKAIELGARVFLVDEDVSAGESSG